MSKRRHQPISPHSLAFTKSYNRNGVERTDGLEHLVALVHDKVLHLVELQRLLAEQAEDAAGGAHEDVRRGVLQGLTVLDDGHTCKPGQIVLVSIFAPQRGQALLRSIHKPP